MVHIKSLSTPYLVPTWSNMVPIMFVFGPILSPHGLRVPYVVCICWSLVCLVSTWSLFGRYLFITWSLTNALHRPSIVLPGPHMVLMCFLRDPTRHMWTPGPCTVPYLVPMWSFPDLSDHNIVPKCSLHAIFMFPTLSHMVPTLSAWSLHDLCGAYMICVVLTRSWSALSLRGPYPVPSWSLPGPYPVPSWSIPGT